MLHPLKSTPCEACRCPNVGQLSIVSLGGKKPEIVDGEVARAMTRTYTLKCMRKGLCQGSYQANAALQLIIFKIARVVPAMPMMIVDVHERINNTQDKDAIFVAAARYLR